MPRLIENCTEKIESEFGHSFTYPMRLQHRKHFSMDLFEIGPMGSDCDMILPFWWIAKYPPLRPYSLPNEIRFNQFKSCSALNVNEFSLEMDSDVLDNPEALIVGSISSIDDENSLSLIPPKFNKWQDIMTTEAAQQLPDDKRYDHATVLKDGQQPPWAPVYPLSESDLEVLREWLKEMLETGKIRKSKLPAAAPILFVPNPHRRGLRLCVDYREFNKITIANRYPLLIMNEL
jgi:hypothetical protein